MKGYVSQLLLFPLVAAGLALAGCPSGTANTTGPGKAPVGKSLEPREALAQMLAAYRKATNYSDKGVVRLSLKRDGQKEGDTWPVECAFAHPNRLALEAFQANIVCDGTQIHAVIADPATKNLDGQMIVRPAPAEIKLVDLSRDALLYDILSSRLRRLPIQLELLLANDSLQKALATAEVKGLEPAQCEQHLCQRVVAKLPEGEFTFWIDQESHLLRRLDYPVAAVFPELAADPTVRDATLTAELRNASFEPTKKSVFVFTPPPGAKPVRAFVTPPPPLPSKLLGQNAADFHFTDLEGQRVSPKTWIDKAVVLVWYGNDPACAPELRQLSRIQEALADESKIAFYAVCADPPSVSNDEVRKQLQAWEVKLPVVRDLDAVGRDTFGIEDLPTLLVLDDLNVVQFVERGANPDLARALPRVLDRLLAGENLAKEMLDRAAADRATYETLISKGGVAPSDVIEVPQAEIKPASAAATLKLTKLWTLSDLKQPGNLLVLSKNDAPREAAEILVCEGLRSIVRVGPAGQRLGEQALDLPETAASTYLRTITNKAGERFYAAASPLAAQCVVFDGKWQPLFAYPPLDQRHEGIRDVRLADLDNDGTPELYVGFWGLAGVQAVSLSGERLWVNREFPTVTSLAVGPPSEIGWRQLLVTGDSGGILKLNKLGHRDPEIYVKGWPLGQIVAADFEATQAQYLGLSQDEKSGQLIAVGLNREFQATWDYPLPPGVHSHPLEFLQPTQILHSQAGEWLLAGADGTLHLVSENGEFSDSFALGAAITGIATTRIGDQPVLLVATEKAITAWEVK